MKALYLVVVLICCIFGVNSEIEERLKRDFYYIYKNIVFEAKELKGDYVYPESIKYFLFTKDNISNYTEIDPKNPKELINTDATIVFIIHGWTENREKQWYEDLKNAFLSKEENYYVVQVDWRESANQLYTISSYNTKYVGFILGEFIVGLHKNYSIPLEQFLLVGHSLGGQVCGCAGKKVIELTGKKLPRIVALDPAGPFFISRPNEKRLNKNDAKVVQVIHTDGGTFGFKFSCGTIDFFPNGGYLQPGCINIDVLDFKSITDPVSCNHHRSWELYIEAILNPTALVGRKCSSWDEFKKNVCEKIEVAIGDLKTEETGEFYLATNADKPFNKKKETILEDVPDLIPPKEL